MQWMLPRSCSVFTGEIYAVYKALKFIDKIHQVHTFSEFHPVYYTFKTKQPIVRKAQHILLEVNKRLTLFWIPAHKGIQGNETTRSRKT